MFGDRVSYLYKHQSKKEGTLSDSFGFIQFHGNDQ
jgi:hypothetical protein